jgi:hypothetical protein
LRRSRQQLIVAPLCTGAVVLEDNIGTAIVSRRTIRILRESGATSSTVFTSPASFATLGAVSLTGGDSSRLSNTLTFIHHEFPVAVSYSAPSSFVSSSSNHALT